MGRTNPTFRDLLAGIEDRWGEFRRTLRRRDQPRFDRLFAYARRHADAAGVLNHEDRLAPVLVSVDLEQEREIEELRERVEALTARVEALETRTDSPSECVDPRETCVESREGRAESAERSPEAREG